MAGQEHHRATVPNRRPGRQPGPGPGPTGRRPGRHSEKTKPHLKRDIAMDLESWTMKELAELERLSGQGLQAIGDDNAPKARVMTVLAYLTTRREDPKFKLAQAEEMTWPRYPPSWGWIYSGTTWTTRTREKPSPGPCPGPGHLRGSRRPIPDRVLGPNAR